MIFHLVYKYGKTFFHFVTLHACDGQTDGQTASSWLYRASHYMQRHGKTAIKTSDTSISLSGFRYHIDTIFDEISRCRYPCKYFV